MPRKKPPAPRTSITFGKGADATAVVETTDPIYAKRVRAACAAGWPGWKELDPPPGGGCAFEAPAKAFAPRPPRKVKGAAGNFHGKEPWRPGYPPEIMKEARRMAEPPESTIAAEAALERWVVEMEAETAPKPQPKPAPAPDAPFDPLALIGADKYEEFHGDPEPPEDPDDDLDWI